MAEIFAVRPAGVGPFQLRLSLCALLFVGFAASGCRKKARSADQAFLQLERAVAAADALALWDCLDQDTRAAIESTYHDQRLARTIISARYPESDAARALAPLAAANAPDAATFFAAVCHERRLIEPLRTRLGSVSGPIISKADEKGGISIGRGDGVPFRFRRDPSGFWGFAEWETLWNIEKDRASHAVQTIRDNAKLYQQAGGP